MATGIIKKIKNVDIVKVLSIIVGILFFMLVALWLIGYVERRYIYPLKYKDEIISVSYEYDLNPYYLFAMVKTESNFNKDAVSRKGAKGLMQITESTGEYIASIKGIENYDLFNVQTNLSFGCYYFKYLLNKFNTLETAVCAYNAGEGTVRTWLKDERYSKDGISLYNIPYRESDNYVKKFNQSLSKYTKLYGNIVDKS